MSWSCSQGNSRTATWQAGNTVAKIRAKSSLLFSCLAIQCHAFSIATMLLNLWTSVLLNVKVIYHLWVYWDSSVVFSHHTLIAFAENQLVAGLSTFAVLFPSIGFLFAVGYLVCVCVSGLRLRLGYCKCMRYQSLVPSRWHPSIPKNSVVLLL